MRPELFIGMAKEQTERLLGKVRPIIEANRALLGGAAEITV